MYTVRCDNDLLLNKFVQGRTLIEPTLRQKANSIDLLTFDIAPLHPCYNSIHALISKIKVYDDGVLYWLGRAKTIKGSGKNTKSVVCESCLSYLKDGVVSPYEFTGSPAEFFKFIIDSHNATVSDSQKILEGTCTITDPNNYIVRSSTTYDSPWNVLNDKMIKKFGGYLYVTFDVNETPILNYYKEPPYTCSQTVEFGENLSSYEESFLYDTFYTACIPLGVEDNETGIRLNISEVNDGSEMLVNDVLAAQYGIRIAPVNLTTWDDVTMAANLKVKGQDWLDNVGIKHKETARLNAIDISRIRQGIGSFKFLWNVGLKLRGRDTVYYVLSQLDLDLNRAANVNITLGDTKDSYTGLVTEQIGNAQEEVLSVVESEYTTYQQSQQIAETVIETTSQIQIQANAIISQVLESYYTKEEVDGKIQDDLLSLASQVKQLSDQVSTSFTYYQKLGNSVTEIKSWVTIVPETPNQSGGIIIGNSASAIKLKLENDMLYFYVGEDTAPVVLMWLDHDTLHIDHVEIQRLSVGVTGKMVDFRIVGSGVNTCVFFSGRLVL